MIDFSWQCLRVVGVFSRCSDRSLPGALLWLAIILMYDENYQASINLSIKKRIRLTDNF